MEINNTNLTELEISKIKQKICPKCNDGFREDIKTEIKNGREYTYQWLTCINYYCRWEVCINETSVEI